MSNTDAISESLLRSSLEPVTRTGKSDNTRVQVPASEPKQGKSFDEVLKTEMLRQPRREPGEVRFSAHAAERMRSRQIEWSADRQLKLQQAVDRAAQKGAKDSLVLMGDLALVVSVTNRTVVTAINGTALKDNVFTNIDSAVVT